MPPVLTHGLMVAIAALIAVFVIHLLWFRVLPSLIAANGLGTPRICQYLELVAATPCMFGESWKVGVRHHLLRMYNHLGQAERVLRQGEQILQSHLAPTLESEIRTRIADAQETLGNKDDAQWQRNRAKACLDRVEENRDAAWYVNRGRVLESQRDVAGACEAYTRALERTPPEHLGARAFSLLSLALAEFNLGRIGDAIVHAEEAASLAQDSQIRLLAVRHASMCHATAGHIEESEHFDRLGCDLARERGDRKTLEEASTHLAENLRKRGCLTEALQALEDVRAANGESRRYHSVRYEVLRSAGRFEEALQALEASASMNPLGLGRGEAKIQGLKSYGAARLLTELGRLDEAELRLAQASQALADDPKLSLWCRAAVARLRALQGRRSEALGLIQRVEARHGDFAQDRNTVLAIFGNLGRAAEASQDFERGIEFWKRYLESSPNPVDTPTGLLHLGECHRGLGDTQTARKFYQRAADMNLETHESRLARARLEEPGDPLSDSSRT
jgi:tetratricopeptide (TPR) repeat protein